MALNGSTVLNTRPQAVYRGSSQFIKLHTVDTVNVSASTERVLEMNAARVATAGSGLTLNLDDTRLCSIASKLEQQKRQQCFCTCQSDGHML